MRGLEMTQTHTPLPCPFCGGEAKHSDGGNSVYGRLWHVVWCDECQVEMRDREVWKNDGDRTILALPERECVERWNRRAPDASQAAEIERMREALTQARSELTSVHLQYGCEKTAREFSLALRLADAALEPRS